MHMFHNKNVMIAPYSRLSDTFRSYFVDSHPDAHCVGFFDRVQKGENIFRLDDVEQLDFDYVLIISPNHFEGIYHSVRIREK